MCAGAGTLRQGWQCSSEMTAGQLYSDFRLRLSCFREISKWVGGANHAERGGPLGGGSKNFLTHINLSEHVSS